MKKKKNEPEKEDTKECVIKPLAHDTLRESFAEDSSTFLEYAYFNSRNPGDGRCRKWGRCKQYEVHTACLTSNTLRKRMFFFNLFFRGPIKYISRRIVFANQSCRIFYKDFFCEHTP